MRTNGIGVALVTMSVLASGCRNATVVGDSPTVQAVVPANAATGVDPNAAVVITFTHAMMTGMEMRVALHNESLSGTEVAGSATWSSDRRTLTFTPAQPLESATRYALHLAGAMLAASGQQLNHSQCLALGGQPVTGGMMGGGMGQGMMGPGWQANDGTYGMAFTFTTS
jgi:hypothetical protein